MRTPILAAAAAALVFVLAPQPWSVGPMHPSPTAADAADTATAAAAADTATAAAAAGSGPIASWRLDEGSGEIAVDSSGNGHHGVLQNVNPKWSWIPGQFGSALRFDSFDDEVLVPAHPRLKLKDELTVEAWARFGSFGTGEILIGNGLFSLYRYGGSAGHRMYFLYRVEEPAPFGDSLWSGWAGVRTGTELEDGRWYHVAATMSDETASIYLNGVLERELDSLTGLSKDASEMTDMLLGAAPFGGSLDEVAIYDRALPPDEIAAHAARGFWRLDEGAGATASDSSPYGNDCTLHHGASGARWVTGQVGNALAFDGADDYADCGSDLSQDPTGDLTIELWSRFDAVAERQVAIGDGRFMIAGRGVPAGEGVAAGVDVFFLNALDGEGAGGESPWSGWTGVRSPTPVTVGEWHHVLAVRRGSQMQVYVDGLTSGPLDCLTGYEGPTGAPGPLRLGEAPFAGALDQIMIGAWAISDAAAERRYHAAGGGAHANPTGDPIGGGPGYSRHVDPSAAVYVASRLPDLLHGLTQGANGDIVYVADDAVIDLTGQVGLSLRGGVTLASGRGRVLDDGTISPGALLFTDQQATSSLLQTAGENVRVTGIRLRGPNPETLDRDYALNPLATGIVGGHPSLEIDNCELWGWGRAALILQDGASDAYVHHNRIHHNRRAGYGYGITLSGASALVEANEFDYNRFHVMGSGRPGTSLEARHNVVLGHASAYDISMYGARDFEWSTSKGNWRFDEGRGRRADDTSSYADNDCAVRGPSWVEGRIKTGLSFDGDDDHVTCGAGQRLNLTERVSLEAWVKPRSLPPRAEAAGVAGKNGGASSWPEVPYQLAQLRAGAISFSVGDGTEHEAIDIPVPRPGAWHHVVGVYEPGHMYAYLDGELVAETRTGIQPHVDEAREFVIGRWQETFDGVIDEVRLHSAALTTDQVRVHMDSPDIAGQRMAVHHNTFFPSLTPSVVIRGRPADVGDVHHNWFRLPDRASAVRQYYADENLDVYNNRYGPDAPDPEHMPRAVALADPWSGRAPLTVRFDGSSSFDPAGDLPGHRWSFADGPSAQGAVADGATTSHTFELPGRYDVELMAIGRDGVPARDTVRITAAPPPGQQALSFWVKDSYVGELPGRYLKQALIGQELVWEDDVAGDEGWQHVVVDATDLLRGRDEITLTLRVSVPSPIAEPLDDIRELMVYWDDVAVFHGAVANGGFESAAGWSYSEAPRGVRWSGAAQSGEVRSGARSYRLSYPYNVATETGAYAQIEQVVTLTTLFMPYTVRDR